MDELRSKLEKHPLVTKISKMRGAGYKVHLTSNFYILPGSYMGTVSSSGQETVFFCSNLEQLETFLDKFTTQDEAAFNKAIDERNKAHEIAQAEKQKQQRGTYHYVLNDEAAKAFPLVHKHILRGDSPFHRDATIPPICKDNRYDTIVGNPMDVAAWQAAAIEALDRKIDALNNLRMDIRTMDVQATEELLKGIQAFCKHFIENGEQSV